MLQMPLDKPTDKRDVQVENSSSVSSSFFRSYKQLSCLVAATFVTGTFLLITIQYISSKSMERLMSGNDRQLQELRVSNQLREIERDLIWVESRIRAAVATGDTSHLEGVDRKTMQIKQLLDSMRLYDRRPSTNAALLRLQAIAEKKLENGNALLSRYQATGNMSDTSLVANPGARGRSNEINKLIRDIYTGQESMMMKLNSDIQENGRNAKFYANVLIGLILITGGGLCCYIVGKIKMQNQLILQLDVSERKAREAAMTKESFMANMSHEIRTPLNSILGFTGLLGKQNLGGEPEHFVSAIQHAGENLLSIVDDILDLSKIEAGMLRIVSAPFSVTELLHSIQTLFDERVRRKRLQLTISVDSALPPHLIGDATRLTQILVNLIGNSLKFTERGFISVRVYAGESDKNTVNVTFSIEDTGIGIEKEKLASIFERFSQAEDSTSLNYGGTGLGLSIVRDLIGLQNGNVDVDSEYGKGTTFRFVIPYVIFDGQAESVLSVAPLMMDQIDPRNFRILIVDDNEMNRSLMKHLLNQWMFSFDIAPGGTEAIELLQTRPYDLVLMDIQMPEMDGYAVTALIRSELQLDVPIVAMTAHAMAGEREKCLSNSMDDYISKPINELALLKLIHQFAVSQNDNDFN
jgi:signal transduction histidine kinase/CheY-like chemotaxis protein